MDPYLEHQEFFPALHGRLIAEINDQLQERLPEAYYVKFNTRVWVEYSERIIEPDVGVARMDQPRGGNGTAVAVAVRPVVIFVPNDETTETFLEIRTVQADQQLVSMIEVLSPSNKTSGNPGRDQYLKKQRDVQGSRVNLVEIDLLRGGTHTTAVPRDRALAETGPFDYHVCIHCFDQLGLYYVYPIRLEQKLPEIAIPLLPGDSAVTLDLQAIFNRCYEVGPYRRRSPYLAYPPEPPLTPEQAAWADDLLRSTGILPAR
jgi:hypothetical protein